MSRTRSPWDQNEAFDARASHSPLRPVLAEHFSTDGRLPECCLPAADFLRNFLAFSPGPKWWSEPFLMPSLSWSAVRPSTSTDDGGHRLGSRSRWAVAAVCFERVDPEAGFDEWGSPGDTLDPGRADRIVGLVQFSPEWVWPTTQPDQLAANRKSIVPVVEAHLTLPPFASRGHWHVLSSIAGPQYGLRPFNGISLFLQQGYRLECFYVAVQTALMMTEQQVQGRPLGTQDIIGNSVHVLLDPRTRWRMAGEAALSVGHDELAVIGNAFHRWTELDSDRYYARPDVRWPPAHYQDFAIGTLCLLSGRDPTSAIDLAATEAEQRWFPQHFELVAMALRYPWEQRYLRRLAGQAADGTLPEVPDDDPPAEFGSAADFNCSAVVEFVGEDRGTAGSTFEQWYGEAGLQEELLELLGDYLSCGFPVVASAVKALLPGIGGSGAADEGAADDEGGEGAAAPDPANDPFGAHAYLVYGCHLARPCQLTGRAEVTYGHSIDCFVLSDLCGTPFLKVPARDLCKAMARGLASAERQERQGAHFLVVLPRPVLVSAGEARAQTLQWLQEQAPAIGLGPEDLPADALPGAEGFRERYYLTSALFTCARALARFDPVLCPAEAEASGEVPRGRPWWRDEWAAYLRGIGGNDSTGYLWSVELHRRGEAAGNGDDQTPQEWRPSPPLLTMLWRADWPACTHVPSRWETQLGAPCPLLLALHESRQSVLWKPAPADEEPPPPLWVGRWEGEPAHV